MFDVIHCSGFGLRALALGWLCCSCLAVADEPGKAPLPEPLTLGAAFAALDTHPNLSKAQVGKELAQADLEQQRAAWSPSLSLEAGLRYMDPYTWPESGLIRDDYARLRLTQQITDFGQTSARVSAREQSLSAADLELLEAHQQQLIWIMERFFDGLVSDLRYAEANEGMSVAFIRFDKGQDRHSLGLLSDIDLLELEKTFQGARLEFFRAQAEQRASRTRLAHALNRPDELSSNLVAPTIPERERPELELLQEQALEYSPRLRRLRAELAAARAEEEAVRKDWRPRLRAEITGEAWEREIGSRTGPLAGAVILEMDLADPARGSRLAKARAGVHQRQAELEQAMLEVREELTELWLELELLKVRREEMQVVEEYQDLYLDRSRALYEQEVATDLGDSMTRSSWARRNAERARYDQALVWARIDVLRGKLLESIGEMFPKQQAEKEDA